MQGTIVVGSRGGYGGAAPNGAATGAGRGDTYGGGSQGTGGQAPSNGGGGGRSGY